MGVAEEISQELDAQTLSLLALKKRAPRIELKPKPNHPSAFFAELPLESPATGATIPGLQLRIFYRQSPAEHSCNFSFQIVRLRMGLPERAVSLDVVESYRQSHRDRASGVMVYGPHLHLGDLVTQETLPSLGCDDFDNWLLWFCDTVNLELPEGFDSPEAFELVKS